MSKKILRESILEVVDTQIRDNTPPATRETFDRLISEGFSKTEAREMIGRVIISEMFDMLKEQKEFSEQRFVAALNELPDI